MFIFDCSCCYQLTERLQSCINGAKTADEFLGYSIYDEMFAAQKYFITTRSRRVKGRADVIKQVSDICMIKFYAL